MLYDYLRPFQTYNKRLYIFGRASLLTALFHLHQVTHRSQRLEERIEVEEQKSNSTRQITVGHLYYN